MNNNCLSVYQPYDDGKSAVQLIEKLKFDLQKETKSEMK